MRERVRVRGKCPNFIGLFSPHPAFGHLLLQARLWVLREKGLRRQKNISSRLCRAVSLPCPEQIFSWFPCSSVGTGTAPLQWRITLRTDTLRYHRLTLERHRLRSHAGAWERWKLSERMSSEIIGRRPTTFSELLTLPAGGTKQRDEIDEAMRIERESWDCR